MITIVGPTASGKTSLAVALAQTIGGEIISADSRQVYRGMDIGTGKDLGEYGDTPHHLIDIREAGDKYNVFEYKHDFDQAYNDIVSRNITPVLCGGSGLYVEAAVNQYALPEVPENPQLREELSTKTLDELIALLASMKLLHNTTDTDTKKRAIRAIEIESFVKENPLTAIPSHPIDNLCFGIDLPREVRRERITRRLHERLDNGMMEEVKALLDSGIPAETLIYYGLEYKYLTLFLTGALEYRDMVRELNTAIHQFAKRQMTWFRGMERKGAAIRWIDGTLPVESQLKEILGIVRTQKITTPLRSI